MTVWLMENTNKVTTTVSFNVKICSEGQDRNGPVKDLERFTGLPC